MNPYESPVMPAPVSGPFMKGVHAFYNLLTFLVKTFLFTIGLVIGAVSYTIGLLNCGVECFGIGLFVWLLWNTCVTVAFSGYLIGPINYLTAVGLFVLFKIFFGGNNKPVNRSPQTGMSDEHQRLIQTYERTKATFAAAQRAAGASPRTTANEGQQANGAGSSVRESGR